MKQWHPIFAKLLRPILEGYYEVLPNVEQETARLIVSRPELWRWFGDVYNSLHEGTFAELAPWEK